MMLDVLELNVLLDVCWMQWNRSHHCSTWMQWARYII